MGHIPDLDKIYVYIDLSQRGNNSLFSRQEIHERLNKDVSNCLNKYGLIYEIITPLGGWGGGVEILLDIIKSAWLHKDILGFSYAMFKAFLNIPKKLLSIVNQIRTWEKPKVIISLSLRADKILDYKISTSYIGNRLNNLKYLSDEICKELSLKYPVFGFDQKFNLSINQLNYSVSFDIPVEKQNIFNTYRLIGIFRNLKIKEHFYSNYSFINLLLISRIDGKLDVDNNIHTRTNHKKYFLLLSTRLIKDYF